MQPRERTNSDADSLANEVVIITAATTTTETQQSKCSECTEAQVKTETLSQVEDLVSAAAAALPKLLPPTQTRGCAARVGARVRRKQKIQDLITSQGRERKETERKLEKIIARFRIHPSTHRP